LSSLDLFKKKPKKLETGQLNKYAPLADRMRPQVLGEIVGQRHIMGEGKVLSSAIANDQIASMIFWGPPGCGKTTIAHVIANETQAHFEKISAVLSGVADLRKIVQRAEELLKQHQKRTILFIDEIHRFNKAQQDALLPHVEVGTITLIGATTENPSFSVINALLSRTSVFELKPLVESDIEALLKRASQDQEKGLGRYALTFAPVAFKVIATHCQGDARRALDILEAAAHYALQSKVQEVDPALVETTLSSKMLLYDKDGEEHYNIISAFIKSMRGSDPDAAIYWMMRMLEAGDDPLFVLRRMIIFASEDIGNADPNALQVAIAADTAFQRIGMPEGIYPLAHCCIYLASAPKSNACYKAFSHAKIDVKKHGSLPVPLKLRNAATKHMKEWGYGEGYRYPHEEEGYAVDETYLPDKLVGTRYYHPTNLGVEGDIKKHLDRLRGKRKDELLK
jgi:putative ATPase